MVNNGVIENCKYLIQIMDILNDITNSNANFGTISKSTWIGNLFIQVQETYKVFYLLIVAIILALVTIIVICVRRCSKKVFARKESTSQEAIIRFRKRDKALFYGRKMIRKVKNISGQVRNSGQGKKRKMVMKFARRILQLKKDTDQEQLKVLEPPAEYLQEDMLSDDRMPPDALYMLQSIRVFGHFEKPVFLKLCKHTEIINVNAGSYLFRIGLDTMAYNLTKQIALFVLLLQLCKSAKNYNLGGRTRHSRINRHIFSIPPKSSVTKYSNNFIMQNIGRTDLTVSYGKSDETWKPGTMQHFKNFLGMIYKIENKDEKTRAIVYINNYNKLGFFKRDKNIKTLEESFTLGVNIINDIDKGLPSLINSFWPKKRRDVWQKLERNFEILDQTGIYKIVHEDLDQIEKNIVNLVTSSSGNDYMELARSMVDLEKKFIIKESRESKGNNFIKTNLYTLPFYTNVVTMKIHFYAIGLAKANIFHLDDSQIKILQQYSDNTLFGADGAIKYVNDMYKDAIDFLYNTVYPAELYDVMMIARSHIAVHGLEMIPIWERTNSDPNSKKNPYIDVILYSTFYGTATPNLFQQATPEKIPQPLTPPLKNDKKRAKLSSIKFYSNFVKGFVEGLELKFEERAPLLMGRKTYNETMIDFEGETITSLSLMDLWHRQTLEFILFNGRIIRIEFPGNTPHHLLYTYKIFHLTDHHIASLYMDISNRIDNIAMSFRRNS